VGLGREHQHPSFPFEMATQPNRINAESWRCYMTLAENLRSNFVPPCSLSVEGAALLDTNWLKLYEAAILEINPDKLPTYIGAAEQAIAQRELVVGITELERRKLTDARSMLKTLSRIALP